MKKIGEFPAGRYAQIDIEQSDRLIGVSSFALDLRSMPFDFSQIAKDFLELLKMLVGFPPGENLIVDVKVHMLKPGWYPCIPGWHLDEIPRHPDGTLNFDDLHPEKKHYLMVLDFGTGSLTEFLDWPAPKVKDYTELNQIVERSKPAIISIENAGIYEFTPWDVHRGIPATGSGWRYFIRATVNTQRPYWNKVQNQTQVYIPAVNVGW